MKKKINKIQKLQFELMKRATFNGFDGPEVVNKLIEHKSVWKGCVMTREGYSNKGGESIVNLIQLRDIGENHWNVDTLFILCEPGKEKWCKLLAETLGANEVSFLTQDEASQALGMYPAQNKVLRVWWD